VTATHELPENGVQGDLRATTIARRVQTAHGKHTKLGGIGGGTPPIGKTTPRPASRTEHAQMKVTSKVRDSCRTHERPQPRLITRRGTRRSHRTGKRERVRP